MTNKEAIEVLEVDKAYLYPDECHNTKAYDLAIEALKNERPHGRWISHEGYTSCSNCKSLHTIYANFCPNCGADMRGEDNGS